MKKIIFTFLITALLSGCSTLNIDHNYNAISQDSRAQFLILHYTAIDFQKSLKVLTEDNVSSHYLVSDGIGDVAGNERPKIYQLVDENRRAYHAGLSSWKGQTQLNAASIGIEIVNIGYRETPEGRVYIDFPANQIDLVVALVKKIVKKHNIQPDRILAHSDIAPLRKPDPGPRFPWKRLADEGLIPWPDAVRVAEKKTYYEMTLPNALWFQQKLEKHGFVVAQTGEFDKDTLSVIGAFQMKYRQRLFDGTPDAETAAILDVMTSGGAVLKRVDVQG